MSDLSAIAGVEQILAMMHATPPFERGRRYPHSLPGAGGRALLARGPVGEMELLVRAIFEEIPPLKVRNVTHEPGLLAEGKEPFPVLRIWVAWEPGRLRLLAHLAYEVARLLGGGATVPAMIQEVTPLLRTIMAPPALTLEQQTGLIGELTLLERLLDTCQKGGVPPERALDAWKGYLPAKRDFAGQEVAIEAKATSSPRPAHEVGMEQLEVHAGEELYLWSVSAVRDTSGTLHLLDLIERIEARFHEPARAVFLSHVASYGGLGGETLDEETRKAFRLEPPFRVGGRFESRLWRIDDAVRRLTRKCLVGGILPAHVENVRYTVVLSDVPRDEWHPVSLAHEDEVLGRVVGLCGDPNHG